MALDKLACARATLNSNLCKERIKGHRYSDRVFDDFIIAFNRFDLRWWPTLLTQYLIGDFPCRLWVGFCCCEPRFVIAFFRSNDLSIVFAVGCFVNPS
jgi:hypothetical protein